MRAPQESYDTGHWLQLAYVVPSQPKWVFIVGSLEFSSLWAAEKYASERTPTTIYCRPKHKKATYHR